MSSPHNRYKIPDSTPTLTRHRSTAMAPIDSALTEIESFEDGEHFTYTEIANRFNVLRTTLTRRHKGCQGSPGAGKVAREKLNQHQEAELVHYIEDLTKKV
jgi:phage baseplate assembly protein gpV